MKIITLLTDFGSFYPAQMKGVILSRLADKAGDITFVDIAHDIPPQDVRAGAFALLSSARYFPPGTIHICVVDPGVGTERLGLVVESGGQIFVGPDNGLLLPAAKSLGTPGNPPQAYKIASFEAQGLGSAQPSNTFHGRDVFAPVAALLASGQSPAGMGPRVRPKDLNFGEAKKTDRGVEATVIYVDRFGNLILNMRKLPAFSVSLKGIKLKACRTYAQARRIEPLITLGSHGFAEIAVNLGNAAEAFCLKAGDRIELEEI
ncbi:MAG: S-adenosyl-l-methionine hydroxide adenosyltransferase family protein [Methanothrix sp.]|nr:S-adenosyl-l-methionine hydroxide adenosyltransferase family protein [Methanothrix sp.]